VTPEVHAALVASLRARGLMPRSRGRVVGMFAPKLGSRVTRHREVRMAPWRRLVRSNSFRQRIS
jgi:hypothetical protein